MWGQLPLLRPSLSVSDLTRYLRELLESDEILRDVWVNGEISNLSRPSSGHVYLTLKDAGASLRCVIWRSTALRLPFNLSSGQAVEAHGQIGVYERDGAYQLYIDTLRPAGEGRLYQEFLRLKARLEAEGLFDAERKRSLPQSPRCIGLVTSPTGAALQDMLNTLRRRYPLAEVIVAPAAVQGDSAPPEIVRAIAALNRLPAVDVILLARGGGSLEDLWAFNVEMVVRAVAASAVPVVCGVGHETDFTLADFAADVRAPTPTGAAVLVTPDVADLRLALLELESRLGSAARVAYEAMRQSLSESSHRLGRAAPGWRLRSERQRLDEIATRLGRTAAASLRLRRARYGETAARLTALSPRAVLRRGYALLHTSSGELVRSVTQLSAGQPARLTLADGQADLTITHTEGAPSETSDA